MKAGLSSCPATSRTATASPPTDADLLMITTPGGIEGMFRHAGRDLTTPRPDGFELPKSLLAEASELYGGVILGPPR